MLNHNDVEELIPLSRTDPAARIRSVAHGVTRAVSNTPGFSHARSYRLGLAHQFQIPYRGLQLDTSVLCCLWLDEPFTKSFACSTRMTGSTIGTSEANRNHHTHTVSMFSLQFTESKPPHRTGEPQRSSTVRSIHLGMPDAARLKSDIYLRNRCSRF